MLAMILKSLEVIFVMSGFFLVMGWFGFLGYRLIHPPRYIVEANKQGKNA